jgi:hypothetical protein
MHTHVRRLLHSSACIVTLGSLMACGGAKTEKPADSGIAATPAIDPSAAAGAMNARWTATLEPKGDAQVRGTASVTAGASAGTMTVEVAITGGAKDGTHPWHVHAGTCATGGDIVGPPADYSPLKADGSGAATSTTTVNIAAPTSGDYHVNIHLSPEAMGTIVSCGDLKLSAM